MTTLEVIEKYIELTNSPGSPSFSVFGDQVDWREVHSGRHGGRRELFAAMEESRSVFENMKVEKKLLIVSEDMASLEAIWSGRMIANGAEISVPMIYIFGVRDEKIIQERDYVITPS